MGFNISFIIRPFISAVVPHNVMSCPPSLSLSLSLSLTANMWLSFRSYANMSVNRQASAGLKAKVLYEFDSPDNRHTYYAFGHE